MSLVLTGSWRWKPSLSVVVNVHMSCAFLSLLISIIIFTLVVNLRLTLFTLGMIDACIVLLSLTHKVRVIGFKEPLTPSLFVLLHLLLGVAPHLLVRLDVAGDAQQSDVVPVEEQPLDLFHRAACFPRDDVVTVNAWCDVPVRQDAGSDAFLSAPFT